MTDNYNSIITGKRITELRKEKGLTQENLANEFHIDTSLIGHYERGRKIPIDMLCKIAQYFETSTDYLLGITNCKTYKVEYRAICDSIGIDDVAAEILEEINFVSKGQYLIPVLNFLIKQEKLPPDEAFFEEKYMQIENSKKTDREKKKCIRKVESIYDRMYKRWKDKDYQPILSKLEDYFMIKTEDENLCLTLSGELKKEKEITNKLDKLYVRKKISKQDLVEELYLEEIKENLKKTRKKFREGIGKK